MNDGYPRDVDDPTQGEVRRPAVDMNEKALALESAAETLNLNCVMMRQD